MLLAKVHGIMALATQCHLVPFSSPMVEGIEPAEEGRAGFSMRAFGDQGIAVHWVQGNVVAFATKVRLVVVFGHNVDEWPFCCFTFHSNYKLMFAGLVTQFGFYGDVSGIQCRRTSETIV
jgi:hypothetical protein